MDSKRGQYQRAGGKIHHNYDRRRTRPGDSWQHRGRGTAGPPYRVTNQGMEQCWALLIIVEIVPYSWLCSKRLKLTQTSMLTIQLNPNSLGPSPPRRMPMLPQPSQFISAWHSYAGLQIQTIEQVVKVIWHKAASVPHMDGSVICARCRKCAPHIYTVSKKYNFIYGKFYLQSVWSKIRYSKHRKYQNLWMNNKVRGD